VVARIKWTFFFVEVFFIVIGFANVWLIVAWFVGAVAANSVLFIVVVVFLVEKVVGKVIGCVIFGFTASTALGLSGEVGDKWNSVEEITLTRLANLKDFKTAIPTQSW
jgi:hypothetical protein